jgi:hypothetical protein
MVIICAQCHTSFEAKRADAQFCSPACRKANSRLANLSFDGTLIRGQHENDIPPTPRGIEKALCRCCGKEFSRWIESKVARLVRNEVEGSVDWDSRDFDQARFDTLKAQRMHEMKFCSDECQSKGITTQPLKVIIERKAKVQQEDKSGENGTIEKVEKKVPRRRGV